MDELDAKELLKYDLPLQIPARGGTSLAQEPQDAAGTSEIVSQDDPKVEIPTSELDLLRSCQKIIDAARSMCCAKCGRVFETIDFYEHIFVREECQFDSMNDLQMQNLSSAEKANHEDVERQWQLESNLNDNSQLKQLPIDAS